MTLLSILAIIAAAAVLLWICRKALFPQFRANQQLETLQREFKELQQNLRDHHWNFNRDFQSQLQHQSQFLQDTHKNYAQTMGDVHHRLGEIKENAERIQTLGENIASLQEILGSPKTRGNFGELLLANLLKQILPVEHYHLQYSFKDGVRVDAVILIGDKKLCIDSKFPLENFKRKYTAGDEKQEDAAKRLFVSDVKKHIDAISNKYIKPESDTFDFALMYIPAENVFYDISVSDAQSSDISKYAALKHVILVSPNTLHAYLQVIMYALKGVRVEKSAQNILNNLTGLQRFFGQCLTEQEKVGAHLQHAVAAHDRLSVKLGQMENRLNELDI